MDIKNEKSTIRNQLRKRRADMTSTDQRQRSQRIRDRLRPIPSSENILLYYPNPGENEVDLRPLLEERIRAGGDGMTCLPRVSEADNRIVPCELPTVDKSTAELGSPSRDPRLTEGAFGVPEPDPDHCSTVPKNRLDRIFVPGVAFGHRGERIGYGGGFYDVFLNRLPIETLTVGVAYDFQVREALPVEPHDIPVTEVVTDKRRYTGRPEE